MTTKICVALFAICPAVLLSQTPESDTDVTRIVRVHRDANTLASVLPHNRVSVQFSIQLHALVLSGKRSDVDALEHTIQQLDGISTGGPRNVELLVYVIGGSMGPVSGEPEATGEALTGVLKQLRSVFPYKNYYLLSNVLLRSGQDSHAHNSGFLRALQENAQGLPPSVYNVDYRSASASDDPTPVIHLSQFKFDARIPFVSGTLGLGKEGGTTLSSAQYPQYQQIEVGTEADIDLREGQKVVVSNSNIENANASIFLVLTARLVQ